MTAEPTPIRDALAGARADPDDRRAVLLECVERALGRFAGRSTITIVELAEIMHISRASAYEAVKRGDVSSIRLGERRRVVGVPTVVAMLLGTQANGEMNAATAGLDNPTVALTDAHRSK